MKIAASRSVKANRPTESVVVASAVPPRETWARLIGSCVSWAASSPTMALESVWGAAASCPSPGVAAAGPTLRHTKLRHKDGKPSGKAAREQGRRGGRFMAMGLGRLGLPARKRRILGPESPPRGGIAEFRARMQYRLACPKLEPPEIRAGAWC